MALCVVYRLGDYHCINSNIIFISYSRILCIHSIWHHAVIHAFVYQCAIYTCSFLSPSHTHAHVNVLTAIFTF